MYLFTPEVLISSFYGELDAEQEAKVQHALAESLPLQEAYRLIEETASLLDSAAIHPRKQVTEAILEYSKTEKSAAALG